MKKVMKGAFALVLGLVIVLSNTEASVAYAAPKHNHNEHSQAEKFPSSHAHVYNRAIKEKWTDATCEDYATQTWACSKYVTKNGKKVLCDKEITIVTGDKVHNYVSTATEESEGVYKCACGAIEYVMCDGCRAYSILGRYHIPHLAKKVASKLPHTHVVVEDAAVDSTCENTGLTAGSHCATCGEVFVEQNIVEAKGHAWNEGNVEYEPTCEADGNFYYYCLNDGCEASKTEVIPMLGHKTVVVPGKEATCSEEGYYEYEMCENCGIHGIIDTIPKTGHKEVLIPGTEATCTSTGLTDGWGCENCDKIFIVQQVIPVKEHDWYVSGEYVYCAMKGERHYKCSAKCGAYKCEVVEPTGHTWTEVPAKEATCTEEGHNGYSLCSTCGFSTYTQYDSIPKKGHKEYEDKIKEAGTEHGLAQKKCEDCQEALSEVYEYCEVVRLTGEKCDVYCK